jgi:hypothetical protein
MCCNEMEVTLWLGADKPTKAISNTSNQIIITLGKRQQHQKCTKKA